MDNTKLGKQMTKFETYLMVERGLSKVTAGGYCRTTSIALRRMKKFAPKFEHVKDHVRWMIDKKYSFSHLVNTSLALEHYTRSKGETVKLTRPRKPKRLIPECLSEAEISRLITATKNIREKALLALLAFSGVRNNELCNTKVEDLDLGGNQLTVRDGKNRQDGVVNITAGCTKILIEYLRSFPRDPGEYLFTTLIRKSRLATGDVRKLLRVLARRAKIGRRIWPHLLRHSLATNLLNRGASLITIQQQLRHRWIDSTLGYVRSRPFRTRSEYEHFGPAYL